MGLSIEIEHFSVPDWEDVLARTASFGEHFAALDRDVKWHDNALGTMPIFKVKK